MSNILNFGARRDSQKDEGANERTGHGARSDERTVGKPVNQIKFQTLTGDGTRQCCVNKCMNVGFERRNYYVLRLQSLAKCYCSSLPWIVRTHLRLM